jgi:hypothetical protein
VCGTHDPAKADGRGADGGGSRAWHDDLGIGMGKRDFGVG